MARRSRFNPWGNALQRSFDTVARGMLTGSTRLFTAGVKQGLASTARQSEKSRREATRALLRPLGTAAAVRHKAPAAAGEWILGQAIGAAGVRHFRLFKPAGIGPRQRVPLVVMLHGCQQTVQEFADSTRMNRLAAREGFCVLYPEQDRRAHPQGCWNWYGTRSGLAYAEAATLLAAVDQVGLFYPIDLGRVVVAGLSAGAGMAALLASRHPTRFAGVVMHSGVPPGSADSTASAIGAMRGRREPAALEPVAVGWPPLLVIHGSDDRVVAASNARAAAALWAECAGARAARPRIVQRGTRHPMTITDYKAAGRVAATLCEVAGLGHAWSGGAAGQKFGDAKGPDAARMVWAFAARQFAMRDPAR